MKPVPIKDNEAVRLGSPPEQARKPEIMNLERTLYVEDEPDIQAAAKLALERVGGYKVMICSGGQEALDKAGGFAPDLVLLDVIAKPFDPLSLAAQVRQIWSRGHG